MISKKNSKKRGKRILYSKRKRVSGGNPKKIQNFIDFSFQLV